MNAVIALCHFCEIHGPTAIFCTQTIRDLNIDELLFNINNENQEKSYNNCGICNSIGNQKGIISKYNDKMKFLSTQKSIVPKVNLLIKQASTKSLCCEINSSIKDNFVFFGDISGGYVLSHTFQLNDVQARGFNQLFSIIVLMKDKLFLLNVKPFLMENLKKISCDLKLKAKLFYDTNLNGTSERNLRLTEGENLLKQSSRSLIELTNDENIFYKLHNYFTWILLATTKILTEEITFYKPILNSNKENNLLSKFEKRNNENNTLHPNSLRNLRNNLKSNFTPACFCALTGKRISINGPIENIYNTLMCLKTILPKEMHKLLEFNLNSTINKSLSRELIIPNLNNSNGQNPFEINFLKDDVVAIKWTGTLPKKLPNLLNKIIKAINETLFNDFVLEKHLNVLVNEWKYKVVCLNYVKSSNDGKLRKILGIQQHDIPIINYWILFL